MDLDNIIEELNKRFAAPLPEFYNRRLIFWHDEDGEFADQIGSMELDDAKIVVLGEKNNFEVKKLLNMDDSESNYLVYVPVRYEKRGDNWLLDMELYSEEFHADIISMWLDEMRLPHTQSLRTAFKTYSKFMGAKDRRARLASLQETPSTQEQLERALMSVLSGLKAIRPDHIIRSVLSDNLEAEENSIYKEFVNYGLEAAFWQMAERGTGYKEENPNLSDLAAHILLSAATRTMHEDHLKGLEAQYSSVHQAYCYDLISDWIADDSDIGSLKHIAEEIEETRDLAKRFMKMSVSELMNTEVFPCIHIIILRKIMSDIADDNINVEDIRRTIEKRRLCAWYQEVENYYDGILQVANMQDFYKSHGGGFHLAEPKKVWDAYTDDYYRMDTYYRNFHKSFAKSMKSFNSDLDDAFKQVQEKVDSKYSGWFLAELGQNWSAVTGDAMAVYGEVNEIPRQRDFYRSNIKYGDSKVYVIISDALRYEVAKQLEKELKREPKSKVELLSMQAIFPTVTKCGMAALLPHKELTAELKGGKTDRLAVLADGKRTDAQHRDTILKAENSKSVAVTYKDIVGSKRADRQEMVKGMDVVYIYHDAIDVAGHDDQGVFEACDEAIGDIKNLIRIITNDFGGANVIVTSDHGFLYTYEPLREDEKVDKTTESDQDIECTRRYVIMKKGNKPEHLMPVKFTLNEEYDAYSPREAIRIKTKGGNLNFVHGGASLQEMVVPVLEYHHLRTASKEYQRNKSKYDTKPVEIALLSASNKISNMIFSLNFYQKDPVGDNREKATYQLYFVDENGKVISDTVKIIADKTSENGNERVFRSTFNLKSMQYKNTDIYYLVIADENGIQISKEEFQIDIAFAVDDFGF